MVAHGTPCLGPITQAGCGAICPAFGRGCYGCFGPVAAPNLAALTAQLRRLGMTEGDVDRGAGHIQRRVSRPGPGPTLNGGALADEVRSMEGTRRSPASAPGDSGLSVGEAFCSLFDAEQHLAFHHQAARLHD